jgi:argininosuccinate lyase
MSTEGFSQPIWGHGQPVDPDMLRFTIGDDWLHDRRLVEHDLVGSLAHVKGLAAAGLVTAADAAAIRGGLERLLAQFRAGEWTVEPSDEDVHSAVERRLIDQVGEPGKRLHTARSRNEQVALDVRLWLRGAVAGTRAALLDLSQAFRERAERADREGALPLVGYTHLRRAMPSSVRDWALAHARAFEADAADLEACARRLAECPLGTGAGYGLPVAVERELVARELGFERPEEPVTLTQHTRGRAELAYVTALEGAALDLGKLAADLWLWTAEEFGFVRLPGELTTGSSLMPQKRNPDLVELVRAHARQVAADRAALADVLRDLPSGYHRDFQLVKPPLFRAHDRMAAMLPLCAKLVRTLAFDEPRLREAAADPSLRATERALARTRKGVPFRDAYRAESSGQGS